MLRRLSIAGAGQQHDPLPTNKQVQPACSLGAAGYLLRPRSRSRRSIHPLILSHCVKISKLLTECPRLDAGRCTGWADSYQVARG
jgi:hypothetical protein